MKLSGPFRSPALLLALLLYHFLIQPASATKIYVGPEEAYDNIMWGLAVASEGDTIIVRDGIYIQDIKVRQKVMLMAENRHQAIIRGEGDIRGRISIIQEAVDGAIIDGFKFEEAEYMAINVGNMVPDSPAENCIIRNNLIEGRTTGIVVSPFAMNTTITGNTITGCTGVAIMFNGVGNNLIYNNTIEDNDVCGIFFSEQYDGTVLVKENTIRNNTGEGGIGIERNWVTLERNLIEGNLIGISTNCGRFGIIVQDSNQVINNIEEGMRINCGFDGLVQNNIISGNGQEGMRIGGNITVKGNRIDHNSGYGVWITDGAATVEDNDIYSNGIHGVEIAAEAISADILQNRIWGNMQCGIMAWGKAVIRGNRIRENLDNGIIAIGPLSDIEITDQNIVSNNMGCEIVVEVASAALIRGNTIEDSTNNLNDRICHSGILINGKARVEGNLIRKTNSAAINIKETATEVTVSGGNIIDSCQYGVVARAHSTIIDNTITNSGAIGIYVTTTGNESTIAYNKIRQNRYGIYFDEGSPDLVISENNISENVYGIHAVGEASVRSNTIQWNDSTGITIQQGGIDLGTAPEPDSGKNSILENGVWNILNESSDTVSAFYNFWGITEHDSIDATIFDDDEDDLSGPVLFDPFLLDSVPIDAYVDTLNLAIRENTPGAENPDHTRILSVFPNPAFGKVQIRFNLNHMQPISLRVFDVRGRLVAPVIENQRYPAGQHQVSFDLNAHIGDKIPGGFYFIRLESEGTADVSRLVLLQ